MGIAVVGKTFVVIQHLAACQDPEPLARLAQRCGLPKPTAFRILQTLAELGYVAQDKGARYYLNTRFEQLVQSSRYRELKLAAAAPMQRLHQRFNETVNLGILDGASIRYIQVLETTRPLRMMVYPNAVDEFYSTSIGRAIVAFLPEAERNLLLSAVVLRGLTPRTVKTKSELLRILLEARQRGYAVDDEETVLDVTCLGVPLLVNGYPVAGISITLPKTRLSDSLRRAMIAELRAVKLPPSPGKR